MPICLSIRGLSLFCSFRMLLPTGHHTCFCFRPLYLLSPLPGILFPRGSGSLCLFTRVLAQVSPPQRSLFKHQVRNESHIPSPSTLTSCLLRSVLLVFTTSLTTYFIRLLVSVIHSYPTGMYADCWDFICVTHPVSPYPEQY